MRKKIMTMLCVVAAMIIYAAVLVHAEDVETLAGVGSHGAEDGEAAQFNLPLGVAVGPGGEIMVADTFNSLIRSVDENGVVTTLTLHVPLHDAWGFPLGGHADAALGDALFNRPTGIAAGFHGWIFVADSHNHAVRVVVGDRVYTLAGGDEEGFADGSRQAARFSYPSAIAVSPSGYLYVADTGNHAIRRIDLSGNVTTVAGTPGVHGYNNGSQNVALFDSPMGLAFCDIGRLFIADTGNHVIRVLYDGEVRTFAGSRMVLPDAYFGEWEDAPAGGFADGAAASARFNRPMGLSAWGDVLFVADSGNHAIRAVTFDEDVLTLAGTGYPGNMDGSLAVASFYLPSGIYVFGDVLLVADTGNSMVRAIDLFAALDLVESLR